MPPTSVVARHPVVCEDIQVTAWRILEWSRERGRGAITSPHFARVEFDAACADVGDFRIGELVRVELADASSGLRVRRVTPDEPRFRARAEAPTAPDLDEGLRLAAESALAEASGWLDGRLVSDGETISLELDNDEFLYGASAKLVVSTPSYLEIPTVLAPRFVRLADTAARSYLATRVELTSADVALAVVDEEDRYFFIVGNRIEFVRVRRARTADDA